jgi:hypothetical protein
MSILINGISAVTVTFDPSAQSVLSPQFRRQLGAASDSLLISTVMVLFLFRSSSEFLRALLLMSSWAWIGLPTAAIHLSLWVISSTVPSMLGISWQIHRV